MFNKQFLSTILALGFRPFFIFAGLSAMAFVLPWRLIEVPWLLEKTAFSSGMFWHGHEMLFGFSAALIVGFVSTASHHWSGIRGIHSGRLLVLVILWMICRIAAATHLGFSLVSSLVFWFFVCWFLFPYLIPKIRQRNTKIWVFIALLGLSDVAFQLSFLNSYGKGVTMATSLARLIILGIIFVLSDRVFAFFKEKALGAPVERCSQVENQIFAFIYFIFSVLEILNQLEGASIAAFCMGTLVIYRWVKWKGWEAFAHPILSILFVGYFWIGVCLLWMGIDPWTFQVRNDVWHGLMLGSVGIIGIGMMSRVSLGHTGRPIKASKLMVLGYISVILATIVRSFAAKIYITQSKIIGGQQISAFFWVLAFAIFLWVYLPILVRPRVDGQEV